MIIMVFGNYNLIAKVDGFQVKNNGRCAIYNSVLDSLFFPQKQFVYA